jgi:hypothetical protein
MFNIDMMYYKGIQKSRTNLPGFTVSFSNLVTDYLLVPVRAQWLQTGP